MIEEHKIQKCIDIARKNKKFIRFLKETKLFREYFRNIIQYHFSYTPIPDEDELIEIPFEWDRTKTPILWVHANREWIKLTKGKTTIKQATKEVNKHQITHKSWK